MYIFYFSVFGWYTTFAINSKCIFRNNNFNFDVYGFFVFDIVNFSISFTFLLNSMQEVCSNCLFFRNVFKISESTIMRECFSALNQFLDTHCVFPRPMYTCRAYTLCRNGGLEMIKHDDDDDDDDTLLCGYTMHTRRQRRRYRATVESTRFVFFTQNDKCQTTTLVVCREHTNRKIRD